jgi:hypothetical protein
MKRSRLAKIAFDIAGGSIRTAGKIEFIRDQGPVRRDMRVDGFEWSPDALKNLSKILWASQRSHSYATAALRLFSKMPSSQFSPDGLLGGRGYIQSVKDMRSGLSQTVEVLSAFTDTVYDEVNAGHWAPVSSESEDLIENTESVKKNPEGFVEQEYEAEEDESFDSDPGTMNPRPEDFGQPSEDDSSDDEGDGEDGEGFHQTSGTVPISHQGLPEWGDSEVAESLENLLKSEQEAEEEVGSNLPSGSSEQGQGMTAPEITMRTTVPKSGNFASAIDLLVKSHGKIAARVASSSLPVDTMSGPRVNHIGPGMTENGWYNDVDALPSDDESLSGFVQTDPILDGSDGITGYDNPTDGDSSVLVVSTDHYSWLPGSRNEKTFNYYDRGLSDSDIEWMRENSDPDDPINPGAEKRPDSSWLWEKL